MATETSLPNITTSVADTPSTAELWRPAATVPLTIYGFPSYEPQRLESWLAKHLNLPLRRDLLHLAVVYEGDNTRQGTASTKTRWEVRGSGKKLYKQKGTGRARVGDKNSPLRRGGGKAFGPKPRDFGTRMTRKAYDLAWRTALSYRYRRGELVVCADGMELPPPPGSSEELLSMLGDEELRRGFQARWAREVLDHNEWGRQTGRSTFITAGHREGLFAALETVPRYGTALDVDDVDVKDLLETGRVVVERAALKEMIFRHQSDLVTSIFVANGAPSRNPESGEILVE